MNIFSGDQGWYIQFSKPGFIKKRNNDISLWQYGNPERDPKLAGLLYMCRFLTLHQIWSAGSRDISKPVLRRRLNKLTACGYLLRHEICNAEGAIILPFYSIGTEAFALDVEGPEPDYNFRKRYGLPDVLKILSVNQLVVNLLGTPSVRVNYDVEKPYTVEISMIAQKNKDGKTCKGNEICFKIISVRNDEKDLSGIHQILSEPGEERIVVIAHNKKTAMELQSSFGTRFKFTWDDELLNER